MGKKKVDSWHCGGKARNYHIPVPTSATDVECVCSSLESRRIVAESTVQELANYIIDYVEKKEMTVCNLREVISVVEQHMKQNAVLKRT